MGIQTRLKLAWKKVFLTRPTVLFIKELSMKVKFWLLKLLYFIKTYSIYSGQKKNKFPPRNMQNNCSYNIGNSDWNKLIPKSFGFLSIWGGNLLFSTTLYLGCKGNILLAAKEAGSPVKPAATAPTRHILWSSMDTFFSNMLYILSCVLVL